MKKNIFFINIKEKILILFLILFSLLVNQYYGNRGVFPVDSFAHFDTGFRVLNGEYPFKDYWIVSGPLLDYIQAFFFYIFGINWQSYIFHASVFNAVLTVSTFLILTKFNFKIYYCFFYSILFSILAYPSSGTPFVDHHSAFFSLLGIYTLIAAIKTEKGFFWILLPIFLGLAFLSKQVPASYVIISIFIFLIYFLALEKRYYWLKYFVLSSLSFIFFLLIFGKIQGISFLSFLEQYILYPQTIGDQRYGEFKITFRGVVEHFKFIYVSLIPLLYINTKNILLKKKYYKEKDFFYFIILIFFTFSLILHQVLTKNQTFIFFLIPILTAFSHFYLKRIKVNNIIIFLIISICLFATFKYHLRFNENRKFHELNYVNFDLSSNGKIIDDRFVGLKWITPDYKNNSEKEIKFINDIKVHLDKDIRNKMLITNYSFYSTILNEKLFSPSRWYLSDGTDYPLKGNKYFTNYKKFLIDIIKKNNISVIYIIHPQEKSIIFNYIDEICFTEVVISKKLQSYELKKCNEING